MKRNDERKELRGLSTADQNGRAKQLAEELMKLRFKAAARQLDKTHRLKEVRRQVARALTIRGETARSQVSGN